MLADENAAASGDLKDFSEKQRELRKTEFDVRDAHRERSGTRCFPSAYRTTFPPSAAPSMRTNRDIAFNLVEEFDGIGHFDQHVVSYLELRKQPYTGCNPRGLTLARDKALTKKILAYHGLKVPEFAIFAKRARHKRAREPGVSAVRQVAHRGRIGRHLGRFDRARRRQAQGARQVHPSHDQFDGTGRAVHRGARNLCRRHGQRSRHRAAAVGVRHDQEGGRRAADCVRPRQVGSRVSAPGRPQDGSGAPLQEDAGQAGRALQGNLSPARHERLCAARLPRNGRRRGLPAGSQSQSADRQGRGLRPVRQACRASNIPNSSSS